MSSPGRFATEHLIPSLEPWMNYDLELYSGAIGSMFESLAEIVNDSEAPPSTWLFPFVTKDEKEKEEAHCIPDVGWSSILNPRNFPAQYDIRYLAQYVGVQVPPGISRPDAVKLMLDEPNWRRGTPRAILAATLRSLAPGAQPPRLIERVNKDGEEDAYHFVLIFKAKDVLGSRITKGDITNLSAVIKNLPTTDEFSVGDLVTGSGLSSFAYVLSVDSPTQVTITNIATETKLENELVIVSADSLNTLKINIDLVKPAGVQYTLIPVFGPIWFEAEGDWASATITWAEALRILV